MAGVKPTLAVDLNGVVLPMPVLAASGCLGTGRDGGGLVDLHRLGGVVTRSLTLQPGKGTSTPRMAETAAGLLTSVGLQNPGVEGFIGDDLPRLVKAGVPVIASVAGSSLEEYIRVTSLLHTAASSRSRSTSPLRMRSVAAGGPSTRAWSGSSRSSGPWLGSRASRCS